MISTCKHGPETLTYDLGVCYGFPHLIKVELHPEPFYNYHPAPLPGYGDWGNYQRGLHDLKNGVITEWGVSLHAIDDTIDGGTVLQTMPVPLHTIPVDIQELGDIAHYWLFQLFKDTIEALEFRDD